jgi:hypothetical protein
MKHTSQLTVAAFVFTACFAGALGQTFTPLNVTLPHLANSRCFSCFALETVDALRAVEHGWRNVARFIGLSNLRLPVEHADGVTASAAVMPNTSGLPCPDVRDGQRSEEAVLSGDPGSDCAQLARGRAARRRLDIERGQQMRRTIAQFRELADNSTVSPLRVAFNTRRDAASGIELLNARLGD